MISALFALATSAHATEPTDRAGDENTVVALHGVRLGYAYVNTPPDDLKVAEASGLEVNPNYALIGYELNQRIDGGSWLNLLFVQNVMLAGMNQSMVRPQANALIGFDVETLAELGVGVNWNPLDPHGRPIHLVTAVGATPLVGNMNVPIHVTWIPDLEDYWRFGVTLGVNWGEG